MSKPKKDKSNNIIYKLEVCYNPDTDEVEYLKEQLIEDAYEFSYDVSGVDMFDYWDEDSLDIIENSYDIGET